MKIAIMQPYIFPYIGYFQLIQSVDVFVSYDNIQFSKGGWFNRNRVLCQGKDSFFTLPLKKGAIELSVRERELSGDWVTKEKNNFLNKLKECYRKAPHYQETMSLLEKALALEDLNLFHFIHHSLQLVLNHLEINTRLELASSVPINHDLRGEEKVIAICKHFNASVYHNAIGGMELYHEGNFAAAGMDLRFIKTSPIVYPQFKNDFVPWLSIIDLLMFNTREQVMNWVKNDYQLVRNQVQVAV